MKKIILLIIIIVVIVGGVFAINYYNLTKTDSYKFKEEYEKLNGKKSKSGKTNRSVSIPAVNPIVYASAEDIVEKIDKKETFLVYFGFSECPWCRSMIENLIEVTKEKNIKEVYYVDVLNIRDVKEIKDDKIITTKKGSKGYMKLLEKLDSVLADYELTDENDKKIETNEKRIYAPNIVGIVNGKAEKLEDGVSPKEDDPYMKLTKEINNESKKEIECVLKCMEKANVCTTKTSC